MNKQQTSANKTLVGGQALLEGIMMRGPKKYCVAVRNPEGEIVTQVTPTQQNKWSKIPLVRGIFSFAGSLITGYKCLMYSAEIAMPEEAEPESKFEKWIGDTFGDKGINVLMVISALLGGSLAIVLFTVIPTFIAGFIAQILPIGKWVSVLEGILKIVMLVVYLALISRMKDIERTFAYHGAEHKTIACYEAGEELTVENIKKYTRFHPRCGTSFLLIVLIVSIAVSTFISWESAIMRVALKLALLPLVMGISYEIIRFAGKYENPVTKAISAPGLWLQRLTTNEPDDSMIEVAIASVLPVLPENREDAQW